MTSPTVPDAPLAGGVRMPLLGFGTWQLTGRTAYDAVRSALDAGYRHLDTATFYRNHAEVGRALRDSGVPREQVFVTTKLWPDDAGRARATIETSLRELGLDQVDLWLVHWPPNGRPAPDTWREFLRARDDGLTRAVGVSNHDLEQIDALTAAAGEGPAVNQIRWNPWLYDPGVAAGLADRGVVLEGYSPLRRGRLDDPVLLEVAAQAGATPAQVVLRWHVEHGFPVIPRSSNPGRIAENAAIAGFTLTPEQVARLDTLGS